MDLPSPSPSNGDLSGSPLTLQSPPESETKDHQQSVGDVTMETAATVKEEVTAANTLLNKAIHKKDFTTFRFVLSVMCIHTYAIQIVFACAVNWCLQTHP